MTEPSPSIDDVAQDRIPELSAGTLLRLAPGEWSHCATARLGTYLEMTVTRVHRHAVRADEVGLWVWVAGHEHPACTWAYVDPHPPCLHLLVRVDVLAIAADRSR
ncbi:hypothetical protein O7626_35925 [Micromonospora sp. WMMD1102]|uniref:hypothetical protein n=1 Tax=Micromonospora sp. WMMD1102 TaxID=3016105 RepID=UPI0024157F15|nr:hypothetical protein [Micromonospora sp. WMMD1102]MDG4791227.1 hypothetical protein [Micromonospora sp. WMMD1102]